MTATPKHKRVEQPTWRCTQCLANNAIQANKCGNCAAIKPGSDITLDFCVWLHRNFDRLMSESSEQ